MAAITPFVVKIRQMQMIDLVHSFKGTVLEISSPNFTGSQNRTIPCLVLNFGQIRKTRWPPSRFLFWKYVKCRWLTLYSHLKVQLSRYQHQTSQAVKIGQYHVWYWISARSEKQDGRHQAVVPFPSGVRRDSTTLYTHLREEFLRYHHQTSQALRIGQYHV